MRSISYKPALYLDHVVDSYWTIQTDDKNGGVFRFAPDGHPELCFNLKGRMKYIFGEIKSESMLASGVIGQFYRNVQLDTTSQELTFFIKLKPLGLSALFADPAYSFNNSFTELEELTHLQRRLQFEYGHTKNIKTVIAIAEQFLEQRIAEVENQSLLKKMLNQINNRYRLPIKDILSQFGLSNRRLQQIFRENVGFTPKQYQRLIRFRIAMKQLKYHHDYDHFIKLLGYYDWSHFSKDMHYYFECAPGEFVAQIDNEDGLLKMNTWT